MKSLNPAYLMLPAAALFAACEAGNMETTGSIERLDPRLDDLIREDAEVEILAEGFEWSEGPLWVEAEQMLLFSDVPQNTIYKWTESGGTELYLTPSGYTGSTQRGGETGSNGLLLNKEGQLVLCQHGDRRVAVMDAEISDPAPDFTSIADQYEGKKFNSPNDVTMNSRGDLFFTDPPYGMEKRADDPAREIPYHGVFRVSAGGEVTLLTDSITRPNGIVLTPDEKTLIVANSDPAKAIWYTYDLERDSLSNPGILRDVTEEAGSEPGLPDGLKVDSRGRIFASGPGGIWIFGPDQELLGKIKLPEIASNCALSADEQTLYITADSYVMRLKMR